MSDFESRVKEAAENSLLRLLENPNNWHVQPADKHIKVPPGLMNEVWQMVDFQKVKAAMADLIQQQLAERIVNHMAAEIANDIKKVLSDPERREAIRAVCRENIDRLCGR